MKKINGQGQEKAFCRRNDGTVQQTHFEKTEPQNSINWKTFW